MAGGARTDEQRIGVSTSTELGTSHYDDCYRSIMKMEE